MQYEGERLAAVYARDIADEARLEGVEGFEILELIALSMLPEDTDWHELDPRDTAERKLVAAAAMDPNMQVCLAKDKMWPGGGLLNHIMQTLGTPSNLRKAQAAIDANDPGIRAILEMAKAQIKEDKLADVASNLGNHSPDKNGRGR